MPLTCAALGTQRQACHDDDPQPEAGGTEMPLVGYRHDKLGVGGDASPGSKGPDGVTDNDATRLSVRNPGATDSPL